MDLSIYEEEERAIIQEYIDSMSADKNTSSTRNEQVFNKTQERIEKAKLKMIKRGIKI